MSSLFRLFIVAICAAQWGCSTGAQIPELVRNFEILAVPKGPEIYRPGTLWIAGSGPEGSPKGQVLEDHGVSHLRSRIGAGFETEVGSVFKGLLAATFGVEKSKISELELVGLSHQRLESLYDTELGGLVLLETITADSVRFRVAQNTSSRTNIGVTDFAPINFDDLDLSLSTSNEIDYQLLADQPLVVAIRVARIEYNQRTSTISIEGLPTDRAFGYRVKEVSPPDMASRSTTVSINNPDIIRFKGITTVLQPGKPFVQSVPQQAIGYSDRLAQDTHFVWDLFSLIWGTPRRIEITRQYFKISPARSGL